MYTLNINNLSEPLDKEGFISKHMKNKSLDIEFIYKSDFKNAKFLRDFIGVICNNLHFSEKNKSRFILIVDELNNNAIEYWTEEWGENKIRFKTVENDDNTVEITIEVEDSGKWSNPKKALDMETLRAHQLKLWYWHHESIRWRGLFMIIVKSVDRLYFKDSIDRWLVVWIKKNLIIKI